MKETPQYGDVRVVRGGDTHQQLVDYAETRLRQEGVETILYEVDPGTGISIDLVGIKDGKMIGVECYVQAQIKKVRPRIEKLTVDRLIFCVPNETIKKRFAEFETAEVWNANVDIDTRIIVKKATRSTLRALGRKGESYDQIINRKLEELEIVNAVADRLAARAARLSGRLQDELDTAEVLRIVLQGRVDATEEPQQ